MSKKIILVLLLLGIVGAIAILESQKVERSSPGNQEHLPLTIPTMSNAEKAKMYPSAKELSEIKGYINTPEFKLADVIGKKIILVDFWTYSCINCQRTLPYLNAWYGKYKDEGLEIVGVHTPEFQFEQKYENVLLAVKKYDIKYPVVLDNNYGTWTAYANRYWPRKYLIDIDGFVVYDHIGEGGYEETEKKIQELLAERAKALNIKGNIPTGVIKPANAIPTDPKLVQSPEIYFGSGRNTYLGNGKSEWVGPQTLKEPVGLKTNILYLDGTWKFQVEYAEAQSPKAKIIFRYNAKNVYFVASADEAVSITIMKDGVPLTASEQGEDVSSVGGASTATVKEERLYKLINGSDYGEHTIEIFTDKPGLKAFTFTFG